MLGESTSEDSSYTGEDGTNNFDGASEHVSGGNLSSVLTSNNGEGNNSTGLNIGNNAIVGPGSGIAIEMTVPITSANDYGGNVRKRM